MRVNLRGKQRMLKRQESGDRIRNASSRNRRNLFRSRAKDAAAIWRRRQ